MRLITYWQDLRMRRVVERLLMYARQSTGGKSQAKWLHELQFWRNDELNGALRLVVLIVGAIQEDRTRKRRGRRECTRRARLSQLKINKK